MFEELNRQEREKLMKKLAELDDPILERERVRRLIEQRRKEEEEERRPRGIRCFFYCFGVGDYYRPSYHKYTNKK